VTPIIFKSYGRDTAGEIVGKLFPYYFPYNLIISILALILFLLFIMIRGKIKSKITLILLTIAVVTNFFITFKLYPDIKSVKQKITTFETESDDSPMRNKFRKLHRVSAGLNILLLIDGVVLLIFNNTSKNSFKGDNR
jgi:amino acid permease